MVVEVGSNANGLSGFNCFRIVLKIDDIFCFKSVFFKKYLEVLRVDFFRVVLQGRASG